MVSTAESVPDRGMMYTVYARLHFFNEAAQLSTTVNGAWRPPLGVVMNTNRLASGVSVQPLKSGGGAAKSRRGEPAWNPLLVSMSTPITSNVAALTYKSCLPSPRQWGKALSLPVETSHLAPLFAEAAADANGRTYTSLGPDSLVEYTIKRQSVDN